MSNLPINQVNLSDSDSFTWVTESGFSISIRGYHPEETVIVNGCIKNLWTPSYFLKKITTEALKINKQGLSVFSTKSDKTPVIKITDRIVGLREIPQTEKEIKLDFSHANVAGIAINCGPVVGKNKDLECLDIDCPKLAKTFLPDLEEVNPDLHAILAKCVEETPSEGLHIFYYIPLGKSKCRDLALMSTDNGKKWLAEAKAKGSIKKVAPPLIETRGAGGYVVGFYSQAVSKIDGLVKPYKMLYGDVSTIPTINADQHDFLMSFAKSCDEKVTEKTLFEFDISNQSDEKKAAIDQWRAETPWNEVLPESYRLTEIRPGYFHVWHPDSTGREPNAIAGCKNGGMDRYWNFSPLDSRLRPNKPLTKDYVYTQARGLKKGDTERNKFYSEIFSKYIPQNSVDESRWGFTDHGKDKPWSGNEEADLQYWKMVDSITPKNPENLINIVGLDLLAVCDDFENPIISGVGAVSILAHIFGIFYAVNTEYGLRFYPNLQQLILADSCIGKGGPAKYAARLFARLSEATKEKLDALDEDIKVAITIPILNGSISEFGIGSAEGLLDKFRRMQAVFVLINEMADFFEARSKGNAAAEKQLGMMKNLSTTPINLSPRDLRTTGLSPKEIEDQTAEIKAPIMNVLAFAQPDRMKQDGVMLDKDFSGGNMSRILVFPEPRKTRLRRDGTMNIPKRPGADPSDEVVEKIVARVVEIVKSGGVTGISNEACEEIGKIKVERWKGIYPKENAGTYIASAEGRGPEDVFKIAFVHSLCKPENWQTVELEDLNFGLAYVEAGRIQTSELYKVVMGSPLQKYVDEFMKFAVRSKEPNRSGILNQWKYRGKSTDKKDAVWVRDILEPELEKLGHIRVIDKKAGSYEVLSNGR